jgi:hypothetical protein
MKRERPGDAGQQADPLRDPRATRFRAAIVNQIDRAEAEQPGWITAKS